MNVDVSTLPHAVIRKAVGQHSYVAERMGRQQALNDIINKGFAFAYAQAERALI